MNEKQIHEAYKRQERYMHDCAQNLQAIAAKIAALASYIDRYMDSKKAEYCKEWLHEIAEHIYYTEVCEFTECELFERIYGVDTYDLGINGIEYKIDVLHDVTKLFSRATNTLGEVILSLEPKTKKDEGASFSKDDEIKQNIKAIDELRKLQGYETK